MSVTSKDEKEFHEWSQENDDSPASNRARSNRLSIKAKEEVYTKSFEEAYVAQAFDLWGWDSDKMFRSKMAEQLAVIKATKNKTKRYQLSQEMIHVKEERNFNRKLLVGELKASHLASVVALTYHKDKIFRAKVEYTSNIPDEGGTRKLPKPIMKSEEVEVRQEWVEATFGETVKKFVINQSKLFDDNGAYILKKADRPIIPL